jgi:F420-0:gamma-glutamyl ligase
VPVSRDRDDVAGAVAITSGVREGDVLVLGSARATLAEGAPVTLAGEDRAERAEAGAPRAEDPRAARRPEAR